MRNYDNVELYLNKLIQDVYPQPEDPGHTALSQKVINHWMGRLSSCKTVLDVGAGTCFCQPMFEAHGVEYNGVTMGDDYLMAKAVGRSAWKMDFSFLDFQDNQFDLVFSRHSLEHSPFPLLSLMEWRRVSKQWLGLVLPTPDWYGYSGQNHYYVLNNDQWVNLLNKAGWNVLWNETDSIPVDLNNPEVVKPHEYWIFCEKKR